MNAFTPEEQAAIEKDIMDGLKQIVSLIGGVTTAMPIAINRLHPHATATRKLLYAHGKLVEAKREFEKALQGRITIRNRSKES